MLYIDLGKKIREDRIEKGYTQEELGEKIDRTGAYIGQIERGERSASMSKIILIAEALDVSLDYLIGNFRFEKANDIDVKINFKSSQLTHDTIQSWQDTHVS